MTSWAVDLFTPASPQTCNALYHDVLMALMSLGDRNYSAPFYIYIYIYFFFTLHLRTYLTDFRERGRENREGEKYLCERNMGWLPLFCTSMRD